MLLHLAGMEATTTEQKLSWTRGRETHIHKINATQKRVESLTNQYVFSVYF